MGIKSRFPRLYKLGAIMTLGFLSLTNYAAYRTLWRGHTTVSVPVVSSDQLTRVINGAEGDTVENRINDVFDEIFLFNDGVGSKEFQDGLFNYLRDKTGEIRGNSLTLEEKINYAQMFSSELRYNYKANFISYVSESKSLDEVLFKSMESAYEFVKINEMSEERIINYKKVICMQYAKIFAVALNSINLYSANPEDIKVGMMLYVPDAKEYWGAIGDFAVSAVNATLFSEWRSTVPHAINIVATEKKAYLIEPQASFSSSNPESPAHFDVNLLEANRKYAKEFLK